MRSLPIFFVARRIQVPQVCLGRKNEYDMRQLFVKYSNAD